ncbi:MAG: lyase family protein [Desulfobacteraceae bacterium]|jgi:3-carboxy-cis,cis-muconate cycloisomerase
MLNSKLWRDLFSTREMRQIWSESATITTWLGIEQALATVQAEMELIPKAAAAALAKVSSEEINHDRMVAETMLAGRPIVGFVRQLRELVGSDHSPYIHFGTTTQDIIDTATILQMQAGLTLIVRSLQKINTELGFLAEKHAETKMIGRTNGQHAKPITFGMKARLWNTELKRRLEVIDEAAKRGLQVQLAGPVGNLDAFDQATGLSLRKTVAERLGLSSQELAWQNRRDAIGDIILALGQLGGSIEKIAHNINLLSSSEIGELYESPAKGKGASSSMAHKRNQRCSEFGEALGLLTKGRAMQIGTTAIQEHERSGGAWLSEWVIVPEVFLLCSGALKWSHLLFTNLQVDTAKMAHNLKSANKQIRRRLSP